MGIFGFFNKNKKEVLDNGLEKTKHSVFDKISRAVMGKSTVDDEVLDNLEEALITSDIGVETTLKIIKRIEERVARDKYVSTSELNNIMRDEIASLLTENNTADNDDWELPTDHRPYVILVVGVNGVGKTTTIGKLAYQFKKSGKKVYLGAADTFRAAAGNDPVFPVGYFLVRHDIDLAAENLLIEIRKGNFFPVHKTGLHDTARHDYRGKIHPRGTQQRARNGLIAGRNDHKAIKELRLHNRFNIQSDQFSGRQIVADPRQSQGLGRALRDRGELQRRGSRLPNAILYALHHLLQVKMTRANLAGGADHRNQRLIRQRFLQPLDQLPPHAAALRIKNDNFHADFSSSCMLHFS